MYRQSILWGALILTLFASPSLAIDIDQKMILAAARGESNNVRNFISRGANVNARDSRGRTALMRAAEEGNPKVIRVLASYKVDLHYRSNIALFFATKAGNPKAVEELIRAGINANVKDPKGWTALMHSAVRGNPEVAKVLVRYGASNKYRTNQGFTALDFAINNGHKKVEEIIRRSGGSYARPNTYKPHKKEKLKTREDRVKDYRRKTRARRSDD